jgi:hypothetical protein
MSETIQEESVIAKEQQEKGGVRESEEAPEYDEAGLEKLVDSAYEGVDSGAAESIKRADERIDAGPESVGLDKQAGDSIFASGGFAQRINTLKESIAALVANSKAKIGKLLDNKPEVIHFSEMATPLPKTEEPQISAEQTVEAEEEIGETPEQKEKRELREYLENEVFPKLGLTEEEKEKALAEAPADKKELVERSYGNVRASVMAFTEYYSQKGIHDKSTIEQDEKRAGKELFSETLSKINEVFGASMTEEDLARITDSDDPIKWLDKAQDIVYENARSHGVWTEENGSAWRDLQNGFIFERMNRRQDAAAFRKTFPKEELASKLIEKVEKVKNNHATTINVTWESVMGMLREGGFTTATELTAEQRNALGQRIYRDLNSSYVERRKAAEELLGFKEGDRVVYGALADMGSVEGKKGGASPYGDIFLEMQDGAGTTYTEGDSCTLSSSRATDHKKYYYNDLGRIDVRNSQLYGKDAYISKAILEIEDEFAIRYQGQGSGMLYIEAQIPNPTLDNIKKINVPKRFSAEVMRDISNLPNGEGWKKIINIIE